MSLRIDGRILDTIGPKKAIDRHISIITWPVGLADDWKANGDDCRARLERWFLHIEIFRHGRDERAAGIP